jgi:hypothetical protein
MSVQLSRPEKSRAGWYAVGAVVEIAAGILIHSWPLVGIGVCFAGTAVLRASKNRGPAEPQPRTKLPLVAWLYFGGFAVDLISNFLPYRTGSADGGAHSVGRSGGHIVAEIVACLVIYGGGAVLVWATFTRPRAQRGTLIALTVLIGFGVLHVIFAWTFSEPSSGSPAPGLFLDTAASSFLAVRVVMDWIARSKAQPQPANSIPLPG